MRRRHFTGLLLASALAPAALRAADEESLWRALREEGYIALMRHARAPGTSDPPEFQLDDCATQRNLDDEGRAQARRTGDAFREHGIVAARVWSSQWCRCMETATLLGLGPVQPEPLLNSIFGNRAAGARQTDDLRRRIAGLPAGDPVVMVSHQVNISALAGYYQIASGAMVVLRARGDEVEALGQILVR